MEDIVNINVNSVVRLTKMILPGMVERYSISCNFRNVGSSRFVGSVA